MAMTSASFFSPPRRRTVIFIMVIVALHYLALHWFTSQAGRGLSVQDSVHEVSMALLPDISAPPPLPPVAPPLPEPAMAPPPLPSLPSLPSLPVATINAEALPPPVLPAQSGPAVPAAAPPVPEPEPEPAALAPAVAAAPAEPAPSAAPPAAPRYKTSVPASAEFDMQVDRRDADGTKWTGVASMSWKNSGDSYRLKFEAGISMLVARINLLVMSSEGRLDTAGVVPLTSTEKRRGRAQTATHFDPDKKAITFSATTASVPWQEGAQDKASVPFQLAAIGRGDVNQLAGNIDILVGEEKGAAVFRFKLVGEEELETKMGRLVTWHLSRPPKPGTYSSQLDIWLAPSLQWYPVQIRNTEANGAVTTQTVSQITVNDITNDITNDKTGK